MRWDNITSAREKDLDPIHGIDDHGYYYDRDRLTGLLRTHFVVADVYSSFTYQNKLITQGASIFIGLSFILVLYAAGTYRDKQEKVDAKSLLSLLLLAILVMVLIFRWETIQTFPNSMQIVEQDRLTSLIKTTEIKKGYLSDTVYQGKAIIIVTYMAIYTAIVSVATSLIKDIQRTQNHIDH